MPRIVRCGLIQASCDWSHEECSLKDIKKKMIQKHVRFIDEAGRKKVQILCMQELFCGPYFPAEQDIKWYQTAEPIPGPTTGIMQKYAKKYRMVVIASIYETPAPGIYYNTAVVIDSDGKILGIYRKNHIPHLVPGFYEKFYFKPGNLGYPTFQTRYARVGVYICYDRHFPDGARALGLNGAEIIFNPSATVAGISEHLWKLEQPAMAVANQFFVGAINRVGWERPWKTGEFYGQSYFCDPRGQMVKTGPRDKDALVTADIDLDKILEVRNQWQFYRDRRPETYKELVMP